MNGSKINSVQNMITIRRDLRDAWDNYEFGVDPNVFSILVFTFSSGLTLRAEQIPYYFIY